MRASASTRTRTCRRPSRRRRTARGRSAARAASFASVVLISVALSPAAQAHTTRIVADLDIEARRVSGTVDVTVQSPAALELSRVYVWLYPNRFAEPPAGLDDVNYYWVYPARFSPGSMTISSGTARSGGETRDVRLRAEPHATAGPAVLMSLALPEPVGPGESFELRLSFEAQIPERYGGFGCTDDGCALFGGFYPMVAGLDAGGWDLLGPPLRSDLDVTVGLSEPASLVVMGRWAGNAAARAQVTFEDAPYAAVITAPRHHEVTRAVGDTEVTFLSTRTAPPANDAERAVLPYTLEDYPKHVLDATGSALELLAAMGAPAARRDSLVVVHAPLRFDLASAEPGFVAVSDRFYRIWPAKRFRKFHERQLVRAVFGRVLGDHIARAGSERARDIDVAADAAAAYLSDLYTLRAHDKSEFIDAILDPVAFIPSIDQFLYAPQTMFAGAYFGSIVDDDPLRDDLRLFSHERPRGRLYYEKLRDLLSPAALRAAMAAVLADTATLRGGAEAAYGGTLDWFFRQWSGPYPQLSYRLVDRRCERSGAVYQCWVTVERTAAAGFEHVVEPVEVAVFDTRGKRHTLRWDGRGPRGRLSFRGPAAIDRVIVDPRGRLVESKLNGSSDHTRFDNRDDHDTRFVFRNFGVQLNLSDISGTFVLDFSVARVHDVNNQIGVALFSSASTVAGAQLRYTRSFGPEITPDQLLSAASFSLTASRLNAGFFAEAGEPLRAATRLRLGAGVGSDSKQFAFRPLRAHGVAVRASLTLTRLDGTPDTAAEQLLATGAGAAIDRTVTPWPSHTFAGRAGVSAVSGDIQTRSQLIGAGGANGIRGYAPGSLFGRSLLLLSGEWRHTFVRALDWNIGHYVFMRGFGGAAFVDVGYLSPCGGYDPTRSDGWYASAGYGLRLFYDNFGTLPALMRVDTAVRLVDRNRDCLGVTTGAGPAVQVYLSFVPPF